MPSLEPHPTPRGRPLPGRPRSSCGPPDRAPRSPLLTKSLSAPSSQGSGGLNEGSGWLHARPQVSPAADALHGASPPSPRPAPQVAAGLTPAPRSALRIAVWVALPLRRHPPPRPAPQVAAGLTPAPRSALRITPSTNAPNSPGSGGVDARPQVSPPDRALGGSSSLWARVNAPNSPGSGGVYPRPQVSPTDRAPGGPISSGPWQPTAEGISPARTPWGGGKPRRYKARMAKVPRRRRQHADHPATRAA